MAEVDRESAEVAAAGHGPRKPSYRGAALRVNFLNGTAVALMQADFDRVADRGDWGSVTVGESKEILSSKTGFPREHTTLVFSGRALPDESTWRDVGVEWCNALHAIVKLPAAATDPSSAAEHGSTQAQAWETGFQVRGSSGAASDGSGAGRLPCFVRVDPQEWSTLSVGDLCARVAEARGCDVRPGSLAVLRGGTRVASLADASVRLADAGVFFGDELIVGEGSEGKA